MESELQSYINNDLRKLGWGFWHREKGAYHKQRTHNSFKHNNKKCTWADLLVFPGWGYAFFVEVKTKTGEKSQEQINFFEWAKSMKYHQYCVNSIESWELVKRIELEQIAGLKK